MHPAPPSSAAATLRFPGLAPMPNLARKLRDPTRSTLDTFGNQPADGTPPSMPFMSADTPSQYLLPSALLIGIDGPAGPGGGSVSDITISVISWLNDKCVVKKELQSSASWRFGVANSHCNEHSLRKAIQSQILFALHSRRPTVLAIINEPFHPFHAENGELRRQGRIFRVGWKPRQRVTAHALQMHAIFARLGRSNVTGRTRAATAHAATVRNNAYTRRSGGVDNTCP